MTLFWLESVILLSTPLSLGWVPYPCFWPNGVPGSLPRTEAMANLAITKFKMVGSGIASRWRLVTPDRATLWAVTWYYRAHQSCIAGCRTAISPDLTSNWWQALDYLSSSQIAVLGVAKTIRWQMLPRGQSYSKVFAFVKYATELNKCTSH